MKICEIDSVSSDFLYNIGDFRENSDVFVYFSSNTILRQLFFVEILVSLVRYVPREPKSFSGNGFQKESQNPFQKKIFSKRIPKKDFKNHFKRFLKNYLEKNFTDSAPIKPPEPVIIAMGIFFI